MSARGRRSHLLPVAVLLAAAMPASPGERVHTVRSGESASSLAKEYYGNHELGDLLLGYNGRSGTVIRAGERLEVPYCETHRVRSGDTWSGLAKLHLGRAAASSVLARLNDLVPERPLRVGQRIVLPVVVRHTLARGESLASLAQRYYGDVRKSRILQEFGQIEDTRRLAVGTVVEIPLTSLRLKATARSEREPPPVAETSPPAPPEEAARFSEPISAAERLFVEGEYDRARSTLEALRVPVESEGTASDRRELARLLAFVYVAFALDQEACAAYRSVPAPEEESLDPDLVSPRIRDVLSNCPRVEPGAAVLDAPPSAPQI